MKRWVFVFATVHILAASPAKAQTSKEGPMAKLTHSLVLLHEQHVARLPNVTRQHSLTMTLWSQWSMTEWWLMPLRLAT